MGRPFQLNCAAIKGAARGPDRPDDRTAARRAGSAASTS
ncbi:hypothetical protein ABH941_005542 [Streptacidiphilus sp. EB103A]